MIMMKSEPDRKSVCTVTDLQDAIGVTVTVTAVPEATASALP